MKKFTKFLTVVALLLVLFPQNPFAQPYTDNFESYTTGGYIAVQNPTWWTTWSNLPGSGEDGQISTDFASSPTKSVLCDLSPGATDLVLKLGDKTSGTWEVNFDFYIQSGFSGYYNIQKTQVPGTQWAFELYFHTDGTAALYAGSSTPITFTYPKNTWFPIVNHINLDADVISQILDINSKVYQINSDIGQSHGIMGIITKIERKKLINNYKHIKFHQLN